MEAEVGTSKAIGPEATGGGLLAAALSGLLSACGGASDGAAPPAAFLEVSQARPMRQILSAAGSGEGAPSPLSATAGEPSATDLMDWAERVYGSYFPPRQANAVWEGYTYRYYPSTQNYLGVNGGRVYVLGPVSGGVLADVGAVAEFAPRVNAARGPNSDAEAARFLAQASLGVTPADIATVRALGYEGWLRAEMARPISASNWDWLMARGYDVNLEARNSAIGVDAQVWQRLMTAPDALRQRVALAWSEIFVVGVDGVNGPFRQFRMAAWWDLLVTHAFGDFRTFLEAVTLNPSMGSYLNTAGNQREDVATGRLPDENYAREVMQLFTIGLDELRPDGTRKPGPDDGPLETYGPEEVSNLARVFTGWNLDRSGGTNSLEFARRPMVLNSALHSTLEKRFLGTVIPAGTAGRESLRIALDTLANHPNVGPFLGRQLIQRLVTSNPSPGYVGRVAAVWANNGQGRRGDLAAVVRAVLLDDEARDPARVGDPQWGKLREPILRAVHWARSFGATSLGGEWALGNLSDPARGLGQSPLRSPSVFNFFRPGYVPVGTTLAALGAVAPEFQIAHESSVAGYINTMQTLVSSTHRDVRSDYAQELPLAGDVDALLDRVDLLLCARQLSSTTRATVRGALAAMPATSDTQRRSRVQAAVLLVMASPDYLVQK